MAASEPRVFNSAEEAIANIEGYLEGASDTADDMRAEVARLTALLAERDAEIARLMAERDDLQSQSDRLEDDVLYLLRRASALRSGLDSIHGRLGRTRINDDSVGPVTFAALSDLLADDDAALAARGGAS